MKAMNQVRRAETPVWREDTGPKSRVRRRRSAQRLRQDELAFLGEPAFDWEDAESFAGEYIAAATGAESVAEASRNEISLEELGGPFVKLGDDEEVAAAESVRWFGEDES